jgi:hypothetical protein
MVGALPGPGARPTAIRGSRPTHAHHQSRRPAPALAAGAERQPHPAARRARHGPEAARTKLAKGGSKISKRIAKVAVARKLAVLLHALLTSGEVYEPLRNTHARRRRQPLASA